MAIGFPSSGGDDGGGVGWAVGAGVGGGVGLGGADDVAVGVGVGVAVADGVGVGRGLGPRPDSPAATGAARLAATTPISTMTEMLNEPCRRCSWLLDISSPHSGQMAPTGMSVAQ